MLVICFRAVYIAAESARDESQASVEAEGQNFEICRVFRPDMGAVLLVPRLFSVQLMTSFDMTSIGLCLTNLDLFLTQCANLL